MRLALHQWQSHGPTMGVQTMTTDTDESDGRLDCRVAFKASTTLRNVIDLAAARSFASRSDFIRSAVVDRLKRDGDLCKVTGQA